MFLGKNKQSGFTLIEMLVALGIFVTITSVVLVKDRGFNNVIILNSLAYDLALSIREAQVFGLAAREAKEGPGGFELPYGVAFSENKPTQYTLFLDLNNDRVCFGGSGTHCVAVKVFNLPNSFTIVDVCIFDNGSWAGGRCWGDGGLNHANATFRRPNPEAFIAPGVGTGNYHKMEIHIQSLSGEERIVVVTNTGQISVELPPPPPPPILTWTTNGTSFTCSAFRNPNVTIGTQCTPLGAIGWDNTFSGSDDCGYNVLGATCE
jgi:prepilin-type N-terminal cleavage/methylation domain-containing protein